MNIFFLDKKVGPCARYHVDKHVVKMILEYSQILSTAHRVLDGELVIQKVPSKKDPSKFRNKRVYKLNSYREDFLYQATHINHPCVKWTMENDKNYIWLYWLLEALHKEYTYRYDKAHKSMRLLPSLFDPPTNIPKASKNSPIALAMPDEYKTSNPEESYRQYYMGSKRHIAKWKNRPIPSWYV